MYIKIKHIKKLLLISACVFFAGFNYLTYVKADSVTGDVKTCDKAIDNDCDGLINTEEALYGTDANNTDSDGDGYSDGVEIKSGYDPMRAAPGDRLLASSTQENLQNNTTGTDLSVSSSFAKDLQLFISSKESQTITNADITNFISTKLADTVGAAITIDSLPSVDSSSVRIIKQDYPLLSNEERKQQIAKDSSEYYTTLLYLALSNSPQLITTSNDLVAFNQDFIVHVASLSSTNPDYDYFLKLGERLDVLLSQLSDVSVPETMLDMHIKMIRITMGFLSLRDASNPNDPISKMALLSKIQALTKLSTDFLGKDVASHLNQF